jgi:hypothetical protein
MISENAGLQFDLVECVSGIHYLLVEDSAKHHLSFFKHGSHSWFVVMKMCSIVVIVV